MTPTDKAVLKNRAAEAIRFRDYQGAMVHLCLFQADPHHVALVAIAWELSNLHEALNALTNTLVESFPVQPPGRIFTP